MRLLRLVLHQYRNAECVDIEPDPVFNIFWGENAQGKTNILEAIHLLGTLKSFRGARNPDLVRKGFPLARIAGHTECRHVRRRIDLLIASQGKQAKVDGKDIRSAADFFGCLNTVLFAPEEIAVSKGPPAGRRALLDRALFQTDVTYLDRLRSYEKTLRQRNNLLREERPADEIYPWTEGLIRAGALIRRDRAAYVSAILQELKDTYRAISGGREEADLRYAEGGSDLERLQDELRAEFAKVADRERRLGQTLAGPHRDDVDFLIDGRPLRIFASQGQQRSFLLSFKTAQIMNLERRSGVAPVLLLDDMTSELDKRRQEFFFTFLLERRGQVFLTTTDIRPLMAQGFGKASFFRVENGTVRRESVE